jgi:hypothetical protein
VAWYSSGEIGSVEKAHYFAGHRWTFTETLADTDPQTWGGQYLNPD